MQGSVARDGQLAFGHLPLISTNSPSGKSDALSASRLLVVSVTVLVDATHKEVVQM